MGRPDESLIRAPENVWGIALIHKHLIDIISNPTKKHTSK